MSKILERINQPSDLRKLSYSELNQLAAEIRGKLISRVSANGGHLASSLGVVELTIALHRVFDSPRDKIIWDVGHQSYAHKLLTGRRESFPSLRQYGGISGFPDPSESPHDAFGSGHASNSISAALGLAVARDLAGENYQVVAVIGDGALGGGMALESLNQAGQLGTRLIVVLNDNGMAISPTVGALAKRLSKLRFSFGYRHAKEGLGEMSSHFPLSRQAQQIAHRVKSSLKGLVMPTMIWEELGFTYLGPFDGHHIAELEAALVQAQNCPKKGPVFFHIITQKGKGYPEAESNVVAFHGISGSNGGSSSTPTYSEIFRQTVLKLMKENPKVVAITAAMLDGTGLSVVAKEFPQRVFDVGICEQHAVTFAAGLATQGFIPIVAIYSTFLQRAFDQIAHDVCIQKLPVIFAIDRSGIVGEDGKTHQGEFDLSYLCCLPDMIVSAPKDENELQHLLYTAVKVSQPMAIRYPRGSGPGATLEPKWHQIPIGNGELLREGKDVAILTLGSMVHPSLEAAEQLGKIGLECSVINARFAKPLDTELILGTIKNIPYVITVEENTVIGGFGSSVRQLIQESQLMPQGIKCLGIPDVFVEHGSAELLRSIYGLDAPGIARQIVDLVHANAPSYQLK